MATAARERISSIRASLGRRVEQHRPALGDHHRVDHDRGLPHLVQCLGDRFDRRLVEEHPDLDRVHAEIGGHRPDLVEDHLPRNRLHGDHLAGVLGGEGDDRRGAVDAAARERLQVGLDPGAAAGIGARDRDRHWYPGETFHPAKASCT